MTSSILNIIAMNHSIGLREEIEAEQWKNSKPATSTGEIHYWHVERKAKRGKKWIFVGRFFCTKEHIAEVWTQHYRYNDVKHRLVHMMKYGSKS